MNQHLLMCVRYGGTDLKEQFESLMVVQAVFIAVSRDRHAGHEIHHEIRSSAYRIGAGIEHLGNVRMIHPGQRLTLRFEATDDLWRIEPELDQLDRDGSLDGRVLLRAINRAHPAFADALKNCI